ncbi:phage tail-collar fiber domain-containing protein [Aeromonas sp. NJAU223]|uniref:phage tail-collar fiber domain-containing protein n=1 Tax=Aeromonas sp. NJAU223 TaxID=3115650 RepID=UPI003DAA354B
MSQIITNAFSRYWQECLATQVPVVLDEFVLANVPGLDPDAAINPDSGLPPTSQIVHRHAVDQRGRINNDAVAYTIVMDTTVGDFSFNAMYLINKASGLVGMIVHKGLETKLKTDEASGQTGNSLVKSLLMEYDRAAEASLTQVDAGTWQIDYAARLRGMDDDLRLQALQFFGPATFYGDGFKLVNESGIYKVQPGVAYVGGLRAELNEVKKLTPGAKPVGLWLDIYRAGSLLDAWVNHFTLTLSVPEVTDYLDSNGYQHHVTKVAIVNTDGSVTDVRRKRTIELTGDVTGKGILEDAQGVTIAVEIKDNSHDHQIENVEGLTQVLASKLDTSGYQARRDMLSNNGTSFGVTYSKDMDTCKAGEFGLYATISCPNGPPTAGNYFYCETKRIYASEPLLQIAWPYDGDGAVAMRNFSANTKAWSPWREVFDTGHKPTIAEVDGLPQALENVAPSSHTHPGSWLNPINLGTEDLDTLKEPKVYAQHANANTSAARHYPENCAGALIVSSGAGPQQTYHVYNSSRVWRRAQYSTGAWTPWTRDYNTGNKPSAADVGLGNLVNKGWSYDPIGDSYAVRDGAGDLQGRLFRASYQNESSISGAMAFRVNNTTDNYTRYCSNPTAIRNWLGAVPAAHNHPAAQGNADVVASGWGQVGSYAMACCIANVGARAAGYAIAGGYLKLACGSDQWAGRGGTLPGTWKLLGYIVGDGKEGGWNNSTWIRIS